MNKKILWWIFAVSRGGIVRAKIVKKIKDRPSTTSQLARELKLTYQDIRYHIKLLEEHKILESSKTPTAVYFITDEMEENWKEFMKIWKSIKNHTNNSHSSS